MEYVIILKVLKVMLSNNSPVVEKVLILYKKASAKI